MGFASMDAEIKSPTVNGPIGYTARFTIWCHIYIQTRYVGQDEYNSVFDYADPKAKWLEKQSNQGRMTEVI
jgi:hypothetical protein